MHSPFYDWLYERKVNQAKVIGSSMRQFLSTIFTQALRLDNAERLVVYFAEANPVWEVTDSIGLSIDPGEALRELQVQIPQGMWDLAFEDGLPLSIAFDRDGGLLHERESL